MIRKYVIGNWKSNLNSKDIENWLGTFKDKYQSRPMEDLKSVQIIVCPPFVYLPLVKRLIGEHSWSIKLGAQNLSPYINGAYTGEVSGSMLSEFVEYTIIGHSERRMKFHEEEEALGEKVSRSLEAGIKPIYCIPDEKSIIPDSVPIVAYEPVWAIGTGQSDSPENVAKIGSLLKKNREHRKFIYGGSVKTENVKSFLEKSSIDGVLLGKASLDPIVFWEIVINASETA